MPEQKSKHLLPIVLVVGALILLVAVRIFVHNQTKPTTSVIPSTPTEAPQQERPAIADAVAVTPRLVSSEGNIHTLELWMEPGTASSSLSTLTIEGVISDTAGAVSSVSSSPEIGADFQDSSWKFPFAVLTEQDNTVVLKMSAVYISPQAYSLDEPTLLATFPVSASTTTDGLTFTLNPENSKLFDKQNNLLAFIKVNEPQPVTN